jgi:excisionase family DNA binding protein
MQSTESRQDRLLTTRQAAAALGIHERTLRRYLVAGFLAYRRLPGGHYRISEAAIESFGLDSDPRGRRWHQDQDARSTFEVGHARAALRRPQGAIPAARELGTKRSYDLSPEALAQLRVRFS